MDERAKLLAEYFENRKKQLAEERAAAIRNKPLTKSQLRSLMMTYKILMEQSASTTGSLDLMKVLDGLKPFLRW
ncbi:hypothetical protein Tco_0174383 [Tanacetum coccineum]